MIQIHILLLLFQLLLINMLRNSFACIQARHVLCTTRMPILYNIGYRHVWAPGGGGGKNDATSLALGEELQSLPCPVCRARTVARIDAFLLTRIKMKSINSRQKRKQSKS